VIVRIEDVPESGPGGLKEAAAPLGSPLTESPTQLLKPPIAVTLIVELPLPRRAIVSVDGLAARLKPGTRNVTATECVRMVPPEVPVAVTVALQVPGVPLLSASVEVPGTATLGGLSVAETAEGAETVSDTGSPAPQPFTGASDTVDVTTVLGWTVIEPGVAAMPKSGAMTVALIVRDYHLDTGLIIWYYRFMRKVSGHRVCLRGRSA
jgi:hypothetical protein